MVVGAAGKLVRRYPSMSGALVEHRVLAGGRHVVVKRMPAATLGHDASELALQVRQLEAVERLAPGLARWVSGRLSAEGHLVMPFVSGRSLRQLPRGADRAEAATAAVRAVFRVASVRLPEPPRAVRAAFLRDQVASRRRRLRLACAAAGGGDAVIERCLRDFDRWAAPDGAGRSPFGRPRLRLAAHGDLTPANVLVPDRPPGPPAFIDVRGRVCWWRGFPLWDPLLDLASFIVFDAALEELDRQPDGEAATASVLAARDAHLAALAGDRVVGPWLDPRETRCRQLDAYIALRLLGNVSIQLVYAPRDGLARARLVASMVSAFCAAVSAPPPAPGRGTRGAGSDPRTRSGTGASPTG